MYSLGRAVVEGYTDTIVVQRLLQHTGITWVEPTSLDGKGNITKNLHRYNRAAKFGAWLVVLDLDQDADCAPDYVRDLVPLPTEGLLLRIAVRSIEAWLLADREEMARCLAVRVAALPQNPELEPDPKLALVNIVKRNCTNRNVRDDILPVRGQYRKVGPGYVSRIVNFTRHNWRPEIAARNSDSLARCIRALEDLKRQSLQ